MFTHGSAEHRDAAMSSVATGELVHSDPVFHTIIAVDVAGSGSLTPRSLMQIREDLRQIMIGILAKQGIAWESVHHDDLGDGLRLLLPPDQPAMRVLGPFVNDLEAALRAHSMGKAETARLRLRMVVHHGLAYFDGGVWAGDALVLAARLLDAEPLRNALKHNPDANFALIVSEAIHKDVIVSQYGPPAADFRPVQIAVKETRTQAWVYVPGVKHPPRRRPRPISKRRVRILGLNLQWLLALAGLIVTVVAIPIGLFTPEIRCQFGAGECPATSPSPSRQPEARFEVTGGDAKTWSDYMSGGGTAGPVIPKGASVLVSCRTIGLKLQTNGNEWWYRIASPGWDDRFYASADAFWNGPTDKTFKDTPFVDEMVPTCRG